MPLQTFKNLSADRQKEILEVCFEEFAVNDYQSASVSHIVRKLGISKGGFYRYFKDKKDLYHYLLDQVMQMRMQDVKTLFAYADDFRGLLIQNFYQKIRFDMEYPVYGAVSLQFYPGKTFRRSGRFYASDKSRNYGDHKNVAQKLSGTRENP